MIDASLDNSAKTRVPLTRIQKLIGRRMLYSKQTKPCFYVEVRADITDLMRLRPKLKKQVGIKVTTNAFYIRTLALAVVRYPLAVATLRAGKLKIADSVNVGFAVNAPQGLVVPVIKHANEKSLAQIAQLEQSLIDRSRSNLLTLEEMEGETIALSNLGVYGIDSFIGIVPPPASTILAVGNIVPTLVRRNGKLESRKLVTLTLAADAAILTPPYAAQFLNHIKTQLQNPRQLAE